MLSIDLNAVSQMIKSNSISSVTNLDTNDQVSDINFSEVLSEAMANNNIPTATSNVIPAEVAIENMMKRLGMSYTPNVTPTDYSQMGEMQINSDPVRHSKSDFDDLIMAASQKYGVDTALIKAVIEQESSFNPNSVSHAGAKGLMQLMDGTARGFGVTNSFDPAQNIDAGTNFLRGLLKKYDGSIPMALAGYNAGPGRVDRMNTSSESDFMANVWKLPSETQKYIPKVMGYYQQYKGQ